MTVIPRINISPSPFWQHKRNIRTIALLRVFSVRFLSRFCIGPKSNTRTSFASLESSTCSFFESKPTYVDFRMAEGIF